MRRFLIVDDEAGIRNSLAAYMEDEGLEVHTAESSEEALAIMTRLPIDGAVVDIRLPGMDGNAFMCRAVDLNPDIRLVIHTGSADYSPPPAVRALGISSRQVYIKPIADLSALIQELNRPR